MRIIIFLSGIMVLVGCIVYSLAPSGPNNSVPSLPINTGYFLVIAASFISVALFKDRRKEHTRVRFEVYRQLSDGGMPIDELMEGLAEVILPPNSIDEEWGDLRETVTSMLDEGKLICHSGRINVAEQGAAGNPLPVV